MFDSIRRCESRIPPDSSCFIFLVLSLCLRKQRVKGLWKGTQTTWKNTFENQTNTFEDFDKHFCQIRQTLLIFLASVTVLEKTMGEWKGTQTHMWLVIRLRMGKCVFCVLCVLCVFSPSISTIFH